MTRESILITGGSGNVAAMLRPRLAAPGRIIRLLDVKEPREVNFDKPGEPEEFITGSVTDLEAMTTACQGVSAVVHLGGMALESTIDTVLELNGKGTYCTLEAARRAGVSRVVLASSNHAVGFTARNGDDPAPADVPPRPDSLYGVSKVTIEALGRLYHDRYGMDVISLRIGSWFERPSDLRGLATWLSPDDGARLVEACIATPNPGYRTVWGVSANTRRWWSLAAGEAIGYHPRDDAEAYAAELIAEHGEPDFGTDPALNRVGGPWCRINIGEPM